MKYQEMPILSLKFKIPEPRKNYVVRTKLIQQLTACKSKKLTIIKAGAGCGKTTLVSCFIKEYAIENAKWITLDENMNQVFVFWKYVLESTKDYLGDAKNNFQEWFDSNVQKDHLWEILSIYIDKMYQNEEIILVLDDFQYIEDEFLTATLDFFIANMPENMHLVLLTRKVPPINLGTVSMEDHLLFIDEQEIRMSIEESREFLIRTLTTDIGEDKIQTIVENSNGWVGGLQLMAMAAKEQAKSFIPDLNTSERLINDYITNEIYRFLSEEERDFLQKTAILGYFNQEICEQYIPQYTFHEIMGFILKKNLFVVSIDEEAKVYRYHSIMKDYLVGLWDKDSEEKKRLHLLAADIYYRIGDFNECLNQLFAIQAYESIMKMLLSMPQTALTFSYMVKVPIEEIIKNIDFAYQYFFCHYAGSEIKACECIYNFLMEHLKDDETFIAFKHSDLFFNINWEFKHVTIMPISQIEAMPLNSVTKAYLLIKEAYFLFLANEYTNALYYLDKAHEIYEQTENVYIEGFIQIEKTQILEEIGEFKQASSIYKSIEKTSFEIPTMKTSYYIGIAGLYIRQLALQKAKEALDLAKESMIIKNENTNNAYLYTLAELYYVLGEQEKAITIITELADKELYQSIFFMARLLRYPIYRGNHSDLAEKFMKDYEVAEDIIKNFDTDLLYIGILYEKGEIENALLWINNLIAEARKRQNKLKIVEGTLLKARIMTEQKGADREVLNLFIEAISYAYENKIAEPFWFEKVTITKLLHIYQEELEKKVAKEELQFVKRILVIDRENGLEPINEKGYDLTERELEVFNEMQKGFTNKQIADSLCISLATVKTHIINIYGKLGVNNRVAAINKMKNI